MINTVFNYVEACFWIGVGVAVLLRSGKLPVQVRKIAYSAAAIFYLFGISDIVEFSTGAWWRPFWLLLWKAGCVLGLLVCLLLYYRSKKLQ